MEEKAKRNKQQEDNVKSVALDFKLDLETLIKETAADPELIELKCCLEENSTNLIPNNYRAVVKKLTHCWGNIMVDDRVIIPKSLRYACRTQRPTFRTCSDATIFWWPNMRKDNEKKSKTCSTCLNASKNMKFQIH